MPKDYIIVHITTGRFWKTSVRAEARLYLTSPINRAYYVVHDGAIIGKIQGIQK